MSSELQELIELGMKLGYEGEKLQMFVKEQQDLRRENRVAKREEAKRKREADEIKAQRI